MRFIRLICLLHFVTILPAKAIEICSGPDRAARKLTCIHDGDTGWERGVKWRLLNVDTPEIGSNAECKAEKRAGYAARDRLIQYMNEGYRIKFSGRKDRSGRELVDIELRDKGDAGRTLIKERLAQPWPNSGNPWCG